MKRKTHSYRLLVFILVLSYGGLTAVAHEQIDIPGPEGSVIFGQYVEALPNSNIVVIDSEFTASGASNAGRIYVYDGATMDLISTSTGTANQQIGRWGIFMLSNGNFLVRSQNMLTWCSAEIGCPPTISSANSLSSAEVFHDVAFAPITPMSNGNYVVTMWEWNNFLGAVTWCSGTGPCSGEISSSNSLVGQSVGDRVGVNGVIPLSNGNYVVGTRLSDVRGAVTWCSGSAGCTGTISAANSFVGTSPNDGVTAAGLVELANGDYLLPSPFWSAGKGAVTRCPGASPCTGTITTTNSMVGTTDGDQVGSLKILVLTNGNYLVSSPQWDNGAMADAGFVRFCDLSMPCVGAVTPSNALVGPRPNSGVGVFGMIMELSNGNYVVRVPFWSSATTQQVGAVTFCSGIAGCTGEVTEANSLVGNTFNDKTGSNFTALSNGNYVVVTDSWDNGAVQNAGAVTFCSGTAGCVGTVSSSNSLVGTSTSDGVGSGFGSVVALTNGNYVVGSAGWDNGPAANAGAVTWCDGTTGCTGNVSPSNSLVGSSTDDMVGFVIALTDGNYTVATARWNNGATQDVGAATWCSGAAGGCTGTISDSNSLVGTTAGSFVAYIITPLPGGKYIVHGGVWANGSNAGAGAITVCQAGGGCTGAVSSANSLVGTTTNDGVGLLEPIFLPNGNFVVASPDWDNGAAADAGAITLCTTAPGGCVGTVSAANSLVGSTSQDRIGGSFNPIVILPNGNYITGNYEWDNGAIVNAGAVTWCSASEGCIGTVSATNSIVGSNANDRVGGGIVPGDDYYLNFAPNGNYGFRSEEWRNGILDDAGAITFCGGNGPCTGPITSANSVLGTIEFESYAMNFAIASENERLVVVNYENNIMSLFRPTYRSAASGNWTIGSTWDFGSFSFPIDLIVTAPHNVTLDTDLTGVNTFVVEHGGALSVSGNRSSSVSFTVDGNLDLSLDGRLDMLANTLTIGCGGSTSGASASTGWILGDLSRCVNAGSNYTFPVGTVNGYSPANTDVTAVNGPSSLTVKVVQGRHPNAPNPLSALSRYWELTETGDLTAILTFNYLQLDVPAVAEDALELKRYIGAGTVFETIPATLNTTANTVTTLDGITDFSDWTLLSPSGPTSANVSIGGRVLSSDGLPIPKAMVTFINANGDSVMAMSNPFGYYRVDGLAAGTTYVVSTQAKGFQFEALTVMPTDDIADFDITGLAVTSPIAEMTERP